MLGNPTDPNTTQGPQVSATQRDRIMGYINKGKDEGAKLTTGGDTFGNKGYFVQPTVFADVTDDMTIAKEEIFGPVMSILKFSDTDEVIRRANDSRYGLGAGLMTNDVETIFKVVNGIRTGTVYVNCYDVIQPNLPFGGYKDSGMGRELGSLALDSYLEDKTVIIKKADDSL